MHSWAHESVLSLQRRGALLVEDGNHGESRPRPDEFCNYGTAFIRAADMDGGRILFDSASKISETARKRITKGIGAPGDVLISHKGTVGKVARAPASSPNFVCSPQTTFWRSLDDRVLNQDYLHALMRSRLFQRLFAVRAGETDMAGYVSLTSQRAIEVPLPPIEIQHDIANVIGSLDDKIEVNRQMNETLEAMAQAIFRDWFVDFGPTRRRMAGVTDPVAIMGGLTPDTAQAEALARIFPGTLDDDGVPAGWTVRPLDSIATFLNGVALQKYPAQQGEETLPVIKIAELRNGIGAGTGRASRRIPEKYLIQNGEYLFSWSGSLMAKFWTEGEGALNQHLFKVSSIDFPSWFYSLWVQQHMDHFRQIAASKATTMGHIQRGHLSAARTVGPDREDLPTLGEVLDPLVARVIHNDLEARTLAATRDLLLPKLLSGEIRLNAA